jgi:TolB-like protein/Tfp pilus assembly protein PilF
MPIYEFGPFHLNVAERLLLRDGQSVYLKPKIFDLLLFLVQNGGHVVEKDTLMNQLWTDSFVEESNIYVSIAALRKVLGRGPDGKSYIENVPKLGYRFVADVVLVDEAASQLNPLTNGEHQTGSEKTALAVLPFQCINSTEEDEYLGLGITDALITKLCNLRQVIVRPTSAVRKYQQTLDPLAAGQELRVAAVLDGSIQRSGQRIRVTVQMIRMTDGAPLWADKFDEQFTDIFEVEDSISEQVTKALTLRLTREEKERLVKHHTENTEAYQAYLRGRFFWNKRTPEGFKKAIEYFQQAIDIDPNYALAYCGLSDCYTLACIYNVLSPKEYLSKAEKAALKALQLDDTLAEAYVSLGFYRLQVWDWAGAEREYRRAIELNFNYAVAHQRYATYLRIKGNLDEAKIEIRRALEIDPLATSVNLNLGLILYFARQFDQAIEHLLGVVELFPNLGAAHFYLGVAYGQKKMHDEAILEYKKTISLLENKAEGLAYIGYTYAISGRKGEAQKVLDELLEMPQHNVEPYFLALIYTSLGEKDLAFDWLEKGVEEHFLTMGALKLDPMFDGLREDPRFDSLLQRMGLADREEKD